LQTWLRLLRICHEKKEERKSLIAKFKLQKSLETLIMCVFFCQERYLKDKGIGILILALCFQDLSKRKQKRN